MFKESETKIDLNNKNYVLGMQVKVKNLPAVQEPRFNPWVRKILEKVMATYSRILTWRIP